MKSINKYLVSIVLIIPFIQSCMVEQDELSSTISGQVIDEQGKGIQNVMTHIVEYGTRQTDGNGYFEYTDVREGIYTLNSFISSNLIDSRRVELSNGKSEHIVIKYSEKKERYENITGNWYATVDDLNSNSFSGSLNVTLSLTQTNERLDSYDDNIYKIVGSFSELDGKIKKNISGEMFKLTRNNGLITGDAINTTTPGHNMQFNLGESDILIHATSPMYNDIIGKIYFHYDMTKEQGTSDGVIRLEGIIKAKRI